MNKDRIGLALSLALTISCGGGGGRDDHAGHDQHAGHAEHGEHTGHAGTMGEAHGAGHEGHTAMAASAASDTSLIQLTTAFTDQNDRPFAFSSLRAHPTLVAMFYGSCETVCPILLQDIRALEQALTPEQRGKLQLLLVTFDPARDTPDRLRALVAEKGFDPARTTFLRGDDSAVRELSMVLGVQYRRLPDGNFAHSALITLLDPDGKIVDRLEGLHAPNEQMLTRLRAYP